MSERASDRAKEVFLDVLELPEGERAGAIAAACGGDEGVRRQVMALLESHASAGRFLRMSEPRTAPRRIGRFTLREPIGEGAWGAVWLAQQDEPTPRTVAVKLLRPEFGSAFGGGSSGGFGARFDLEQRALARMEHPGIARLIEAGVESLGDAGVQPYLVMEYIDGEPITSFCDRHALALRERAGLLARVCDAVQHAHTKGVLHRDLKPRNVLVPSAPRSDAAESLPRVIDFGIAKLLDPIAQGDGLTHAGVVVGTPQYMSPEQSLGDAVDARTDIFALGVMLYELLCGTTPVDASEFSGSTPSAVWRRRQERPLPAMAKTIEGMDAPRVTELATARGVTSTQLSSRLRGELEWICGTALSIEPERRYASAAAMGDDLRRWLASRPIEAAPPSAAYRARKFASRHTAAVAAAVAALCVLVVGLATTSVGFYLSVQNSRLAELRAEEADRQRAVAEAVGAFLTDDVLGAVVPSTRVGEGRDVSMREVLEVSGEELLRATAPGGRLESEPKVSAALWRALGRSHSRIDQHEESLEALGRTVALRASSLGADHPDTLAARAEVGEAYLMAQRFDEGEAELESVVAALRPQVGEDDPRLIRAEGWLALIYRRLGKLDDALALLRAVRERAQRVFGPDHGHTHEVENGLAWTLNSTGDPDAAIELLRDLLGRQRAQRSANHAVTLVTQQNLAGVLVENRRFEEGEAEFSDLGPRMDEVFGSSHRITLGVWANTATLRSRIGREDEALAIIDRIGPLSREALGESNPVTLYIERLEGQIASRVGEFDRALAVFGGLLARYEDLHGPEHPSTLILLNDTGRAHMGAGDPASAREAFARAVTVYDRTLVGHHRLLITARQNLAEACMGVQDWDEAQRQYQLLAEATGAERGSQAYLPNVLLARRALVLALAGAPDNARSILAEIDASGLEGSSAAELEIMIAVVDAVALAAEGRDAEARERIATVLESMGGFTEDDPMLQQARALRDRLGGQG